MYFLNSILISFRMCYLTLVPGCGFLFEAFLYSSGTYTTTRKLARMRRDMHNAHRAAFTDNDVLELKASEKNSFWFLTFLHLNHMGNTAKRQQFELAYMLDGKGLTDTGRNILASLDIGVGKGTFSDLKNTYINQAEKETWYVSLLPFCTLESSFFLLCFVFL